MRNMLATLVGVAFVFGAEELSLARGPQGGGQRGGMQMQARHQYGRQSPGTGQGQGQMMGRGRMMSQGQQTWLQDDHQNVGNSMPGQGNKGKGMQHRKQNGTCQNGKTPMQNRTQQQNQARQQAGKVQD
jgi:hypothetical protein